MNKKYLLPTLKNEPRLISDECWENIDDIYDFLLDNMKLNYETSGSIFDEGSNSMPHLFEQMLLFHNIFFDKKHYEHDRAIIEWKAILSILALQRIRNIRVEAIKVDLSENSDNPFLRAAASFKPEDNPVFYQTTWDYLYIFCMDGVPIAITSPLTIVCPAKMFKKKISKLNWISIENVNQKTCLLFDFRGKGNEYADLGFWLKLLNDNLICINASDGETFLRYEKVKKELNAFIESYSRQADLEIETYNKRKIYESMNNNIRKEYEFLNNCCDFYLPDSRMSFLAERYQDDIFQQKLIVVVYDDKPDSMFYSENLSKLERLFHKILKMEHRKIISIMEPSGTQLPAYALLPFKKNFVQELISRQITAEDFFDEYIVIYNHVMDTIEIRLSIQGFPYSFYKIYSHEDWQLLYGQNFVSTYLWPEKRINTLDWKRYYTWVYKNNSSIKVDIPYALSSTEYKLQIGKNVGDIAFQLLKTETFPPYIRYSYGSVSGYLPISSENVGLKDTGGTIGIFVDIGHTSTYVTMLKIYDSSDGKNIERVAFRIPCSVKITGDDSEHLFVNSDFVTPKNRYKDKELYYFRNAVHSFYSYKKTPDIYSVSPFEDGQTLFHWESCLEILGDDTLHFLNFDYDQMKQHQKRHAHIFIEQILLFAIHTALLKQCSYIKIYFLHCYDDNNEKVGQLEGLWKHALKTSKAWTGISESMEGSIYHTSEQEALTANLYKNLISYNESMDELLSPQSKKIFASIDIGWKKTLVTHIYKDENNNLQRKYTKISFGGYEISMIDSEYEFQRYDEMISIFLTGSCKVNENTPEGKLLWELKEKCQGNIKKCENYYYGLFDLIAMQIEKNNYVIPPDVYNKMDEFRGFIKMMTYNILLLFLNIGYILGYMCEENQKTNVKELHLFLGGNGAKFLKWISNIKDYTCIDENNDNKILIVGIDDCSILNVLNAGFKIINNSNDLNAVIHLEDNMKEEMLNGYIFKEVPMFYDFRESIPPLKPNRINNSLSQLSNIKQEFYSKMDRIKHKIFSSEYRNAETVNNNSQEIFDISQIICGNSRAVCKEIIQVINNMKNND